MVVIRVLFERLRSLVYIVIREIRFIREIRDSDKEGFKAEDLPEGVKRHPFTQRSRVKDIAEHPVRRTRPHPKNKKGSHYEIPFL